MTANRSHVDRDELEVIELEVIEFLKLHDDTVSRDWICKDERTRRYIYTVEAKYRYGIVLRSSAGGKRHLVWCLSKQIDRGGEKGRNENKPLGQVEGLQGCSYVRDDPWEMIWISAVLVERGSRRRLDRQQTKYVLMLAEQQHGSRPPA
jgi:hypothetical protein